MINKKFVIQDNQYEFPYHYLASIKNNIPQIHKTINWGFEYLTYMNIIINEINQLKFNSILDIGCGDGYLLNNLDIKSEKLGVDLSEKAIMFAKAFAKEAEFEVKDIFDLQKQYDLVTLIEVLEHIPDEFIQNFINQVLHLVKINGYFIISVPTTVQKLHPKHYRHYDESLLDKHLNNTENFELLKEERIYKVTKFSKFLLKQLHNKRWTINSKFLLNYFWKWHLKNNTFADIKSGYHIVRIYKKIR